MEALPLPWVQRIFDLFHESFGEVFDITSVDPVYWSACLAGFSAEEIKTGIASLRTIDSPPAIDQFIKLCRPLKMAKVVEKMTSVQPGIDHKRWAKKILARDENGEAINATVLRFAQEAMRCQADEVTVD